MSNVTTDSFDVIARATKHSDAHFISRDDLREVRSYVDDGDETMTRTGVDVLRTRANERESRSFRKEGFSAVAY